VTQTSDPSEPTKQPVGLGLSEQLERKLRRQLDLWRSSLVAVDGRQRLVYFKHMKTASLEIAAPGAAELIGQVSAGTSVLTAPEPEGASDNEDRLRDELLLRRPHILVGNKTSKELSSSLRRLDQVSQQTFADRGFWSLYVGAGFIAWRDHDDKPAESPLLLVPVRLRREGDAGHWSVESTDDDIAVNPALQLVMEKDYGITLPEVDADDVDLDGYLADVREAVAAQKGWSVAPRAVMTTFSFHKEAIYRDLTEHAQQVLEHPMVQLLALGPDAPSGEKYAFEPVSEDAVDVELPPEKMMSILDADSSQRKCIIAAREGRSFVMDGPPGTGKSQTIANIVVELISAGKSVLFVSEKAAALDVVRNRLAEKRLDPFLLELHSHAATRKQVAAELNNALTKSPRAVARFGAVEMKSLAKDRNDLTEYAEAMNAVRPALGRSLFAVLGRVAHLEKHRDIAVPSADTWAELDDEAVAAILDRAAALGRAWGPVVRGGDFLWRDLDLATGTHVDVDSMQRSARRARDAATSLVTRCDAVDEDFGMPFGRHVDDAVRRRDVLTLVEGRPEGVVTAWLSQDDATETGHRERAAELVRVTGEYHELTGRLLREAGPRQGELDSDLSSAVDDALVTGELGWTPAPHLAASGAAELLSWLRNAPHRLVEVNGITQRLGGALGFGAENPTLGVAERLGGLAVLGNKTARPLAPWFHPGVQAALGESERVLDTLVSAVRSRREALSTVFTTAALELDLAALDQRFRETHTGLGRFSGQARADRKLVKSVTVSGKAKKDVLVHLGEAAEWQRAERALDHGEQDHAGRLGSYYRRVDTDFDRVSSAIETARRAVQLAGDDIDVAALARQLGADGDPDPLLTSLGERLSSSVQALRDEAVRHLGSHASTAAGMSLHAFAEWCTRLAEHLSPAIAAVLHVAEVTGRDVTVHEAQELLRIARARDTDAARVLESYDEDVERLGSTYRGLETDWPDVELALDWAASLRQQLGGSVAPVVAGKVMSPSFASGELSELLERWSGAKDELRGLFAIERRAELDAEFLDLDAAAVLTDEMVDRASEDIHEWIAHVRLLDWFEERGLATAVRQLAVQAVPADDVAEAIERVVLAAWVDATVRGDARLDKYRSVDRDALVAEFQDLDRRLIEDRYSEVVARCAALRPTSRGSRGAQVIVREAQKKTRHKPIRQLLTESASLVQGLKPCFMMSPLSVSQYLPASMRFDVVIFDEASQVLPWDAVNCVYRGEALIVAGDQKQLPPTSFFGTTTDVDEYDDSEDTPDSFESVLDIAKATGALQSLSLLWHYRSQHESLITYSNHRIYERTLHTFPGAKFDSMDLGVQSFVVDGVYMRGGTRDNPVEADFVVDRIVHHRREHRGSSLGVVTFSAAQEDAILAAMELRSAYEPVLQELLNDHDRLDGFFVKSLENVQGDERDIILFSIGYGRDEFGKLSMNFGPLNRKGGWRRLNVAITRARRRVEIISSIRASDIANDEFPRPDPDQNGVPHLKAYLDFADRGISALAVDAGSDDEMPESPFEEDVIDVVRNLGYQVDAQVGTAGYRIDLAVRHPDRPGEYAIGIECDGAMYHSAKAARDRDRLRQQVLEGLGWRIHRIWGLTWVRDRQAQIDRLRKAIESAIRGDSGAVPVPRPAAPPELVVEEVDFDAKPDWAAAYPPRDSYGRLPNERSLAGPAMAEARPALRAYFERVIRAEAPVHHGRLLECFRNDWGVGRVGAVIQKNIDLVLSKVTIDGRTVDRDAAGFLSIRHDENVTVRVPEGEEGVRKIGWIPPDELDRAIVFLIRDAKTMDKDHLGTAVCRLFGWRRLGADIQAAVASAVSRLIASPHLVEKDGELLVGEAPALRVARPKAPTISVPTTSAHPATDGPSDAASPKEIAERFAARVQKDLETVEAGCGYRPSYFIHKLKTLGSVRAAQHMLTIDDQHYNLRRLAKNEMLELSLHAAVLDPHFRPLFSEKELRVARERLRNHGGSI
jgi:very-short-patch-repair endonuclease